MTKYQFYDLKVAAMDRLTTLMAGRVPAIYVLERDPLELKRVPSS